MIFAAPTITAFKPLSAGVLQAAQEPPLYNRTQTLEDVVLRSKLPPKPRTDNTLLYIAFGAVILFILYKYKYI